ncbi:MAG: alpha/beta hydrolase [Lachnospiraceae bacterium]|nr:alpha/beta hydrolase [Lachnospiraceae bacterium]
MSEYSDRVRVEFACGDKERDKGLETPKDIVRFDNISYGTDEKFNLLDVYKPVKTSVKLLPVIVIIHGGAWVYGDKEVYQFYGMSLAERGFAVVNPSYRLAPENRFPAQIEDICSVFDWIAENADKYCLDITNIFAVGDSAGGHLLSLYTSFITNDKYAAELKRAYPAAELSCSGLKLKAIALNCGKYDMERFSELDPNTPIILMDFLNDGGSRDELKLVNATALITGDYPPVFLMTCAGDFLKCQATLMVEALMDASVPFVYRFYGTDKDPLGHVFHCNMRLKEGIKCNDDECEYFKEFI